MAQAAIAHAQFETIHPFVDGNGRAGRALIHLILRRRGLAPRVVPPISLVLATLSVDYVAALSAYRYQGAQSSPAATEAINRWVALFSGCYTRAVRDAAGFDAQVRTIQRMWREKLGPVRRGSAADLLVDLLPGTPIVTVNGAASLLGRSFRATNSAVERLVEAKVLHKVTLENAIVLSKRARYVISAFTDLERRLGSPDGDTLMSPPTRAVPNRRE